MPLSNRIISDFDLSGAGLIQAQATSVNISLEDSRTGLSLGPAELESLFGARPGSLEFIPKGCWKDEPLYYRELEDWERDSVLLQIIKRLDSEDLEAAGKHRLSQWESGWSQNLIDFIESGYDLKALVPGYYKKMVPFRLQGELYKALVPDFVYRVTEVFRTWLFRRFFQQVETIAEFGCGSGFHLARLAELFPGKQLYGFDWTEASRQIISLLRKVKRLKVKGGFFDFFAPDGQVPVNSSCGVLTFGALEQVGTGFGPFLDLLMAKRPAICVHVECIAEFYDTGNLLDYLALIYHRRRNYLEGFLPALKQLEARGEIEIVAAHHQRFGNLYDDSHSYIVWKPAE